MDIVKLVKRGNSQAICLPRAYLRELGWAVGDHVYLEILGEKLLLANLKTGVPGPQVTLRRLKEDQHVTG